MAYTESEDMFVETSTDRTEASPTSQGKSPPPRMTIQRTRRRQKRCCKRCWKNTRYTLRTSFVGGGKKSTLTAEDREVRGLFGTILPGMYWLTGTAIFVEGLLSGLYHTCPSRDFQQFDYIGITTCEIAIFLMMWSKCHPRLPSPGSFGVYIAFFGVLSAVETSSQVHNKPYVWAFLWVCIFFFVPIGAASLHFSLPRMITAQEMRIVIGRVVHKGQKFEKTTMVSLGFVAFCTMAQIGQMGKGEDWTNRVIIGGAWLVTVLCIVLILLVVKLKKRKEDDEAIASVYMEKTIDEIEHVPFGRSRSEFGTQRLSMQDKQHTWRPIRIAVVLLWWFMGFNTCLKGILSPADYNLSHGIMSWHGQGAFLYYMYWFFGMVYFGTIDFKEKENWGKLFRLACYFLIMMGCAFWGAEYFVNDSYKASADVTSVFIPCDPDGLGRSVCKREWVLQQTVNPCAGANISTIAECARLLDPDRNYPCGQRDGKNLCLIGSLDYNKECVVSVLDGHSVWHFLSATSLFVLPLSVMVVDELMMDKCRDELAVL